MLGVELEEKYNIGLLIKIFQKNKLIVDQFLFNNHSFRIAPPLTITNEQIEEISETIKKSLNELKNS